MTTENEPMMVAKGLASTGKTMTVAKGLASTGKIVKSFVPAMIKMPMQSVTRIPTESNSATVRLLKDEILQAEEFGRNTFSFWDPSRDRVSAKLLMYGQDRDEGRIVLTSAFGMRKVKGGSRDHKGIDLRASFTPLFAMGSGYVLATNTFSDGNKTLDIAYPGAQIIMTFMHLSKRHVKMGDYVNVGDIVATSGDTGTVAPHLHLEITYIPVNKRVNPLLFLTDIVTKEGYDTPIINPDDGVTVYASNPSKSINGYYY